MQLVIRADLITSGIHFEVFPSYLYKVFRMGSKSGSRMLDYDEESNGGGCMNLWMELALTMDEQPPHKGEV